MDKTEILLIILVTIVICCVVVAGLILFNQLNNNTTVTNTSQATEINSVARRRGGRVHRQIHLKILILMGMGM